MNGYLKRIFAAVGNILKLYKLGSVILRSRLHPFVGVVGFAALIHKPIKRMGMHCAKSECFVFVVHKLGVLCIRILIRCRTVQKMVNRNPRLVKNPRSVKSYVSCNVRGVDNLLAAILDSPEQTLLVTYSSRYYWEVTLVLLCPINFVNLICGLISSPVKCSNVLVYPLRVKRGVAVKLYRSVCRELALGNVVGINIPSAECAGCLCTVSSKLVTVAYVCTGIHLRAYSPASGLVKVRDGKSYGISYCGENTVDIIVTVSEEIYAELTVTKNGAEALYMLKVRLAVFVIDVLIYLDNNLIGIHRIKGHYLTYVLTGHYYF